MSAILNINSVSAPLTDAITPIRYPSTPTTGSIAATGDSVEFSSLGTALSRATELSTLSVARIRAIRDQIENGTFETPERISGTASRLLEAIR